jgi:hypothetical protein
MKKFQVILLALTVVSALSAVLASSASAEATLLAEWLIKGVGVTTLTSTEAKGSLKLADNTIGVEVECTGIFDGSVGASGEDETTEVLTTGGVLVTLNAPLTTCKSIKGCEPSKPIELAPNETLPWHTLMYLDETTGLFLDTIFQSAGFEITCTVSLIKDTDTCSMTKETGEVKNATGGAEGVGMVEPAANCSLGGSGAGLEEFVLGNHLTNLAKEEVLVSE